MNQKLKAIFSYVGFNSVFAALAYYGVYVGVPWCVNFFMFASWVFFALSLFSFGAMYFIKVLIEKGDMDIDKQAAFIETPGRKFMVPMWIDYIYDVAMLAFLVYYGWVGYAMVYLVTCVTSNLAKRLIKNCVQLCKDNVEEDVRQNAATARRRGEQAREDTVDAWDEEVREGTVDPWEGETDDDDLFRMGVLTENERYDPPPARD